MFESNTWFWIVLMGIIALFGIVYYFRTKTVTSLRKKRFLKSQFCFSVALIFIALAYMTFTHINPYEVERLLVYSEEKVHSVNISHENLVQAKAAQQQLKTLLTFAIIFVFVGATNFNSPQPRKNNEGEILQLGLNTPQGR